MSVLDTNGFNARYYIRVQRNMIERGIRDTSQYFDLFINEITTDFSMNAVCECCSQEEEKIQHIKYMFHLRSRKNADFAMVVGSTCIHQFKQIDPNELKHALLLYNEEKKRVERLKKEDREKERASEYAAEYAHFIHYLKRLLEYKNYLSNLPVYVTVQDPKDPTQTVREKTCMLEVHEILTKGKKVFREKHEVLIIEQMAKLPLAEIEEKIKQRENSRTQRQQELAEWQKKRQEEAQKRKQEQIDKGIHLVNDALAVHPNNTFLQSLLTQLNSKVQLSPIQWEKVESLKKQQPVNVLTLEQEVDKYVAETQDNNAFVSRMQKLLKRNVTLTDGQRIAVERILLQHKQFKLKYTNVFAEMHRLGAQKMSASNAKKFKTLQDEFCKTMSFGKFFDSTVETKWMTKFNTFVSSLAQVKV